MQIGIDTLGTAPLATIGDGATSVLRLDDTFSWTDTLSMIQAITFSDEIATTDSVPWLATRNLSISSEIEYTDLLRYVQSMLLADTFDTTDTATQTIQRIMAIASALVLTDVVGSWRTAVTVLADALALTDSTRMSWAELLQDTFQTTDTIRNTITPTMVDSLILTTTVSNSITVVLIHEDTLSFTDDVSPIRTALMSLSDNVILGGIINIADEVYDAWVMNTETGGVWQYTNYPFTSYTKFGGKYYGIKEDGLYEITGTDDDGTDIEASIKTGLLDFGTSKLKRVPRAFLGLHANGDMLLNVTHTTEEGKVTNWHRLEARSDAPEGMQVKLGRGPKARYWQFELKTVDGTDFSMDDLKVFPIVLKRRI